MDNFSEKLLTTIQTSIIKGIQDAKFIESWNQNKISIPSDIVRTAYESIDREKILHLITGQIEEQIAKTIVGQLLTETANDTKRIMSDPSLRQQIKNKVYPEILRIAES